MDIKVAVYNMEWMANLFTQDGQPEMTGPDGERSSRLAEVVRKIDPDILGIVEGPDTTVSGSKSSVAQLEAWVNAYGLDASYKAVHGFTSGGRQELCALYKSNKLDVQHKPVQDKTKNPFDEPFLVDTTESLIKEYYKHYRPPLELSVRPVQGGDELARIIVAHVKSKGIFDRVDFRRYEQLSELNRMKLYAECISIRERCDQWLEDKPDRPVIVMGDINDGFGQDYYELRFRRSAVEILLGDVWYPERIFRHVVPKPKIGKYGWTPSTSQFTDKITDDRLNVLIDHILVSLSIKIKDATVWNPYLDHEPNQKQKEVKSIEAALKAASDHFPMSAILEL